MLECVANSGGSPKSLRYSSMHAIVSGRVTSPTCGEQRARACVKAIPEMRGYVAVATRKMKCGGNVSVELVDARH
eukprot:364438-Chlamydomonas_euryale.AAC.4